MVFLGPRQEGGSPGRAEAASAFHQPRIILDRGGSCVTLVKGLLVDAGGEVRRSDVSDAGVAQNTGDRL